MNNFDNDYIDPMFVHELFFDNSDALHYIKENTRGSLGGVYYEDESGNRHPINFVKAENGNIVLTRIRKESK